ncbi:ligase-associated DNA damage response endonuclease PdeM [Allorhizobium sp. BGMRC 0089]|uniref:ligase-associated DNA damage response endonuclease PdeM n=1 Tax=Allorhizobium sonneratiae TaxID=2934936 RepID=UPI0020336DDC|nr:ligase-associated DNA damage response endonuclease PdeM [Allorhizobium sonneratiae]MCM2291482.1 ligase-associated DNA damage response endonuclease PdeM [Allorhizobium sonneratiae]
MSLRLNRDEWKTVLDSQCETVFCGHVAIFDLSGVLYLPDLDVMAVSDMHLEKGAAFARRGMMLPPYDTLSTLDKLEGALQHYDPKIVVSLGDNFHDRIGSDHLPEVFRSRLVQMMRGREVIWVNGNHDPDGVVGLPGMSADAVCFAGLTFRHEPEQGAGEGEIAGHLHPAATVRRRDKAVRRPCFACDGTRLIMPAFGALTGGLDLAHRAFSGLFQRKSLTAHLLGKDRLYSIAYDRLKA